MIVLALWKFPLWRWLMLVALTILLLEVAIVALLGGAQVVSLVLAAIVAVPVLSLAIVVAHVVCRLVDRNRLVLLAPDRGSSLDVIFKSKNRISLANHGRMFGATSAGRLRAAVAAWLVHLDSYRVDIRAQNTKVAEHYIAQFPQLEVLGRDWMGHPKLGLTDVRAGRNTPGASSARVTG